MDINIMLRYVEPADCWGWGPRYSHKQASLSIAAAGVGYCPYIRSLNPSLFRMYGTANIAKYGSSNLRTNQSPIGVFLS
jgi:hypothetical protein